MNTNKGNGFIPSTLAQAQMMDIVQEMELMELYGLPALDEAGKPYYPDENGMAIYRPGEKNYEYLFLMKYYESKKGCKFKIKNMPLVDTIAGVDWQYNQVKGEKFGNFHVSICELPNTYPYI